ncbi:MAG: hypothetical protein R3F22_11075 [Lysobacteraceae bacterium]
MRRTHLFPASNIARLLLLGLLSLLLVACGGRRTVKPQVFAPSASIQELRRSGDDQWTLTLRLQNFSNVGMRIERVDAQLRIADGASMSLQASPGLTIAPNSAEPYPLGFQLNADAARAIADALSSGRSVNYALKGRIDSSEPKSRNDDFEFESSLTPVPGLSDTLR